MLMEAIAPAAARERWRAAFVLAALLAVGLALRLRDLSAYAFFHPDEIVQYLEQAHRLAFGYGVVPWDVRFGLRSGLIPLLLSGPMRLGAALDPGGDLYLLLPRLCVMLISLAPIWAAWAIGKRHSPAHAIVAAAVVAIWYESIVFADHVLSEPLVVACFLPAAALIDRAGWRRVLSGALLAFAAVLRPQYAPAAAILALLVLKRDWPGWIALTAGALPVLIASGCVDLAMGQAPFGQLAANLQQNLVHDRAAVYGTLPPLAYLGMLILQWGPLAIAAPLLIAPVARREWPLLAAALMTLALHMAIGHKEYRYIWLPAQTLLLLAALGSTDLVLRALRAHAQVMRIRTAAVVAVIAVWALLSAALGARGQMAPYEPGFAARLEVTRIAGRTPGLCGVAIYGTPYWSSTYAYLHRPLPLYLAWRPDRAAARVDLARGRRAYDGVIAPAAASPVAAAGYRPLACRGTGADRVCLWTRPGGCDPTAAPGLRIERVLRRENS